MAGTKAAAAQDALVALLSVDSTLSPYWLDINPPTPHDTMVYVAGEWNVNATRLETGIGAPFEEHFDLTIRVWVQTGATFQQARGDAMTLADAARAIVQANPTLSGTCLRADVSGYQLQAGYDDNGQAYQIGITLTVSCDAYLI